MSELFCDSFDAYTDLGSKYDYINGSSFIVTGQSRTGLQCLFISGYAYGPAKNIKQTTDCLVATCWKCSAAGGVMQLGCFGAADLTAFTQGGVVILNVNADGSINVTGGFSRADQLFGTSAPGLVRFGIYNSLAMRTTVGISARTRVYVNGVLALDLNGYDNRNLNNTGLNYTNSFMLMAPPGSVFQNCYHDDVYVLDCTTAPHNAFLGPLRIYAGVPDGDGTVQWAPSVGITNYPNVDTIPPNPATYNSSPTSGQADQYIHPLPAGVPSNSQIFGVQHCQCLEVDSGALGVTSDIDGTKSPSGVNLTTGYAIYCWPYDVNPATTNPWSAADFPLLAGPSVV